MVSNLVSYALKVKSLIAEPLDLDRVLHTLQSCSETLVSIRHESDEKKTHFIQNNNFPIVKSWSVVIRCQNFAECRYCGK